MNREIKFRAWDGEKMRDDVVYFKEYTEGIKQWVYMQFTGLKDKNGREIYEGDIVNIPKWYYTENLKAVVRFGPYGDAEEYCDFVHTGWYLSIRREDTEPLADWNDRIEVVGNVYETPDLLSVEKEDGDD